jgi:DHA3 family macrolide efflux protein-like MFS transporter
MNNWKRIFTTLYVGQAFSLLSSSAVQFSIIWWITLETESPMALTIASVVGLLPQAIIGLFACIWIDRFKKKTVIIISDIVVAISSFFLFLSFILGFESLLIVYVVLFIRALGETFHKPALQTLIPSIVPKDELTRAGGFGQMINSATMMVGPMLGALLMSITTLPYAMLIDVLGALIAVSILVSIRYKEHLIPNKKSNNWNDFILGLKVIRQNKILLRLSLPMFIITIIFVPIGTLLPLIVKIIFNGGAWHNGFVQTMFSFGMLFGSILVGVTGGFKNKFIMISLSSLIMGLGLFSIGYLSSGMYNLFVLIIFTMGVTGVSANIPFTAYVQSSIPREHLGKVLSLITSVMSFAAPVGMFIAGPVSSIIGVENWMRIAGVILMIIGLLAYILPLILKGVMRNVK